MPQTPASDCWFLTGPTATGKTAVGVALRLRGGDHFLGLHGALPRHGHRHRQTRPRSAKRRRTICSICSEPQQHFSLAAYLEAAFRGRGRDSPVRPGGAVCRRDAALFEGVVAGSFSGAQRRLGVSATLTRRTGGPAPFSLSPAGGRGPGHGAGLHPNDTRRLSARWRSLSDRPADQPAPAAVRDRWRGGAMPGVCLDWPRAELPLASWGGWKRCLTPAWLTKVGDCSPGRRP